ncbi:PaaI family thioesterase [Streptosporangium sp. OZ121]|uniref:PaaI family thioesterase n=1 Tax=Streptosporangium sp. OZ121 TaxID=3444183 RepID=UPI003F7A5181
MRDEIVDPDATRMFHELMPYTKEIEVEVTRAGKEEVRARLAWSGSRCTIGGVMHGGVIMGLADASGAACAFLNLPQGATGTTTVESKTNFLRGVRDGHATAVSRPLHVGSSFIVVETDVLDDGSRLVARVTQTQAVLSAGSPAARSH